MSPKKLFQKTCHFFGFVVYYANGVVIMAFCGFSQEMLNGSETVVDNKFLSKFLPEANGDAVKVYLYGLFVCKLGDEKCTLEKFSAELKMEAKDVIDCFKFWDELGIISVISEDPFLVRYLPISSARPKKYNLEKYTEFNKSLQVLIPDRMITTNEYSAYFQLMEEYSIKPEAMLMIVRYCVDLKGSSIGFRYILKVAEDFAAKGITTVTKIEKELSDYASRSGASGDILKAIIPNGKPDIEDVNLVKKWMEDYAFDSESIIFVAKKIKAKNTKKLDRELTLLFSNKKFSSDEIKAYYKERAAAVELAYKIDKALSVYVEVIDPVVDNYVTPWLNKGYDEDSLTFIADYCFRKNKRTLEEMNDVVEKMYKNGLVTINSIADYMKTIGVNDTFIKELLSSCGLNRKPTDWDRENLKVWRSWNFTDEMILCAAKAANGKNNPVSYMNAVLSGWKADGILSPDKIIGAWGGKTKSNQSFKSKVYTQAELDGLIDNIDDIEF